MYSKDQISFLMSSGFSLDEIMSMQQDPAPETPAAPDPVPEAPAAAPEAPAPAAPDPQIQQLLGSVNDLISTIQKNNINNIQFGSPIPDRSVEDVLGEIINPPSRKK